MGNSTTRLGKEDLEELQKGTHCTVFNNNCLSTQFLPNKYYIVLQTQSQPSSHALLFPVDQKEIKELYRQFKKEIQPGTINKKEFGAILKATGFGDSFLQDLMFNVFDRNKDGVISFREFVVGLSVMTRGTPDEKMECTRSSVIIALLLG